MEPIQVLALDIGAESGRAMVGTYSGQTIHLEEVHRFNNLSVRLPDGLHWDLLYLFNEIKKGIRMAVEKTAGKVRSVGIDTWGVDHGLINANGSLTYLPFHYRDERTDNMMDRIFVKIPKEEIFYQTGVQFMSINTLYQLAELVESNPVCVKEAETFLTIPDLLNYWLTGTKACEYSIATTTQLYNPRTKDWAWELIDAIEVPKHIFPTIIPSGTVLGSLLPHVSEEAGGDKLSVIAPACHDTGSAVLAIPFDEKVSAYLSSGTWSLLGIELPEPVINEASMAMNFTNEGGFGGTIRFLKNITGLWIIQECKRYWASSGDVLSYSEITELAEMAEPHNCFINSEHPDFMKPGCMPEKIQRFAEKTGQKVPSTKGEVARCVLESLALKYREELGNLERVTGQKIEQLNIVGGGTQNTLLNQFAANAINREVVTGPIEATAMGNILGQLIALGAIGSVAEARQVVKNSVELARYYPDKTERWDAAYDRYREICGG